MAAHTDQPPPFVRQALERRRAHWEQFRGLRYVRLSEDFHGHPKGTVWMEGRLVPGYPHIGRISRLQQGLSQQLAGPFWAEEKVDGYNVRVLRHQGTTLALTRGGYVCPFTTDRLPDLLDGALLELAPHLVLCAEVAGPDNPYTIGAPPFVEHDVQAFVFDILDLTNGAFLPHEPRRELIRRHGLPAPLDFGRYVPGDWRTIQGLMRRLDAEGREGVVLKEDPPRGHRTKYVTRHSGIYDIAVRASDIVELPGDFFTGRILRMALAVDELGLPRDETLARDLGAALLRGLLESLDRFQREGAVYHTFRCRFRTHHGAEEFFQHLRAILGHTHLRQRRLEPERGGSGEGYWLLELDKEVPKLTGLLHQLFRGEELID
jgi:DNA/RNA ligase